MARAKQAVGHDHLDALLLQAVGHVFEYWRTEQLAGLVHAAKDIRACQNASIRDKLAHLTIVGHIHDVGARADHLIDLLLCTQLLARKELELHPAFGPLLHPLSEGLHLLVGGLLRTCHRCGKTQLELLRHGGVRHGAKHQCGNRRRACAQHIPRGLLFHLTDSWLVGKIWIAFKHGSAEKAVGVIGI